MNARLEVKTQSKGLVAERLNFLNVEVSDFGVGDVMLHLYYLHLSYYLKLDSI